MSGILIYFGVIIGIAVVLYGLDRSAEKDQYERVYGRGSWKTRDR